MIQARTYWYGVLLTALGAVVLSPDALLFRLLESDLWTAAFWRLLLWSAPTEWSGCNVSAWTVSALEA
jgi:hypothetical protein